MKPQRRLVLRREALTLLDTNELLSVAGATHVATDCGCLTEGCLTHGYSCDRCPVPSLPLNTCFCQTVGAAHCVVTGTFVTC